MSVRLNKERQLLEKSNFIVQMENDTSWKINIMGPKHSAFEGGHFVIKFKLEGFPFRSPVVTFVTQIFHPNVDKDGGICADMLQIGDKWAPIKNLVGIMQKIMSMLAAPNLQNPMNADAANEYKNGTWFKKAQEMTKKYAK